MDILFVIWVVLNLLLLVFVVQELYLLIVAVRHRKSGIKKTLIAAPLVTVQLPVYNEKYVIERLLDSAAMLDYPDDKLEIQVLDDSTDETTQIIKDYIAKSKRQDIFSHIRRTDRSGFKAGALDVGLKTAKGEFIAIFDADFIIQPQFLKETLPYFEVDNIGVVQTKWLHINESQSLLTRAQALMLNTHFSIEQLGRTSAKGFINFNGTAGLWRKTCIADAGGWHADTLTEDLDLSYRAQIKKWQFQYLFEVGSPAELPVTFEAYRTQQHRWSKGAAECVRKNWQLLWQSKTTSTRAKVLGAFHLLNSSVYLIIVPLILLSPMVYYGINNKLMNLPYAFEISGLGILTTTSLFFVFLVGNLLGQKEKGKRLLWFIPSLFTFFAITTGISLYMLIGVVQGYMRKSSAFIRTPKFGDDTGLKKKVKKGYDFKQELRLKILESILLLYGIAVITMAIIDINTPMIIYGGIIVTGFSLAVLFNKIPFGKSS